MTDTEKALILDKINSTKRLISTLQRSIDGTGSGKPDKYPAGQKAKDKEQKKILETKLIELENKIK